MTELIPEKRLDKNGVLTTKHVRAVPKAKKAAVGVPAPSLGSAAATTASEGAQKAYKPRPSQTKSKPRNYGTHFAAYHKKLAHKDELNSVGGVTFLFSASEQEMYEVLSVAEPGNAIRLLDAGVRTADEAVKYMRRKGARDAIVDMKKLAQGAFERGISSNDFMTRLTADDLNSPWCLDALELFSYSSVSSQYYGNVHWSVINGTLRLDDIKYIGVSKFKSHNRLEASVKALVQVHEPDQKYTLDDLKELVERAADEGASRAEYKAALEYLMAAGPEAIRDCESFEFFRRVEASHRIGDDKHDRIAYECSFFKVLALDKVPNRRIGTEMAMRFREAGVPAAEAARLLNEGLNENAVIGVLKDGTEKALGSGWL